MAKTKANRVDEWISKPGKKRIAAMRIVWGEDPILPPPTRGKKAEQVRDDRKRDIWLVPSETTSKRYTINLLRRTCNCSYWRDRQEWCKHLEAGRIWRARLNGDMKAGRIAALDPVPNPYKQEPWYDSLVAREEEIVREFARCLGTHFGVVPRQKRKSNAGRPGYPLGDFLACGIVSGYLNRPSRKAIPFMAAETGLVRGEKAPSPQALRKVMQRSEYLEVARRAQRMISMCTKEIDTVFSIDATVMKTPLSCIHLKRAAGGKLVASTKILNCKVQLAIGIETFVVYGVIVTDGDASDQNALIPTMDQFVDFVRLDALLADSGYCKGAHYEYVGKRGGKPYIDFSDIKGRGPRKGMDHYNKALADWQAGAEEWTDAYAYRWLSESANSSYKRTIKRVIRARFEETREAEVVLATLAFSLKWLAHARAKFGVSVPWADAKTLRLIDEVVENCKGRRKKKPEDPTTLVA